MTGAEIVVVSAGAVRAASDIARAVANLQDFSTTRAGRGIVREVEERALREILHARLKTLRFDLELHVDLKAQASIAAVWADCRGKISQQPDAARYFEKQRDRSIDRILEIAGE